MTFPPSVTGLNVAAAKWTLIALVFLGSIFAAYQHGRHVVEGEKAAAERDIAIVYAGEIVAQQAAAEDLAAKNHQLRTARAGRDRIIEKEIVRYEQVTPPALRCALPGAWRLRHDAAATGLPAADAGAGTLDAGAAAPVDDAAALRTVGANYAACRDAIAQVDAWQRRYHRLEAPDEKAD